ncbi:hypothetical protein LWI28_023454 [Acer negundo]|uniref:NB-ARC domain-containing protein n=1 Tax=Acer negundo TaxID=4023 RepID=A0AAD5J6B2_ACENE|nr:hypothetical protein LWI28_023454 [Acer negundo]
MCTAWKTSCGKASVVELQEKGKFSDGLLVNALPSILQIPTAPMGRGVTVERNMGMIWESLVNDEVQKFSVFGMGGVGKTTIMHHINNQLMGMTGNFDNVIWVTFSKAFSVVRLQNEIAASMNLDLSDYMDETRRASKLYAMLTQMKSINYKIIKSVYKDGLRPVKVELLSKEEALDLFMSKVAPQFVLPPEVLEIAELVARKCTGLPLAIVTVAGSMKGVEDIHEWRYASREIANWTEEHKIPRQELIGYWIAEGLITERICEQAATDKGHTILNKLENTCLLEGYTNCSSEKWAKVHDVIREMALKTHAYWKSLRVLDLSYTRIESLPESISLLANLSELSLDHCVDLSHVPSLEKLKALRKLKLGYTKILELPPGIEELINLKILDLYHTHRLEMLLRGKLAHLSQLKCLRIDRSDIKEFNNYVRSQQWQELTNYRLLLGDDADVESYTIGKEVWVINRHLMSGGGDFLIIPNNILDFKLIRCHDIRSLTEISSLQNARDLKTCYVEYCVGIESIFHSLSSQEEQHYIPKSLENLILPDLPFLRVAFRGVVPPYCTHSNLKKLIIYHSANLRNSWKMILQKEMEFQYILFLFSI